MKKAIVLILVSLLLIKCNEKEDTKPKPEAAFSANTTSIFKEQSISFTDNSKNNPTIWFWEFGDGETSTEQHPTHTYNSAGTFSVTLTATNESGGDVLIKENYISVTQTTNVTFFNHAFTDIIITLNGETMTVAKTESITFNNVPGEYASFDAYTMGTTSSGKQIGLKLEWNKNFELTGGNINFNLNVDSHKFFVYIINNSSHNLAGMYVNYGLTSQTMDEILIYNDGNKYRTGYYDAYTNSNVRMYLENNDTYYAYWDNGVHFNLPFELNQSVELIYSGKKTATQKSEIKASEIFDYAETEDIVNRKVDKIQGSIDLVNN